MIPWFSKTKGNTYATLLHHPFLFKGKPTHAQEVARSLPSSSSKRGEVVDEFRQHDGMVTVVVKLFWQGSTKHNGFRGEDELEGEGALAHGLVNRGLWRPLPSSHIYRWRGRGGSLGRAPRGPTAALGCLPRRPLPYLVRGGRKGGLAAPREPPFLLPCEKKGRRGLSPPLSFLGLVATRWVRQPPCALLCSLLLAR